MPTLREIDALLKIEFNFEHYKDNALNGLQVGDLDSLREIKKIALAVDSDLLTLKKAVNVQAEILLVHHGIFWGKSFTITGCDYSKIKLLIENGVALYAIHLPLDAHSLFGNNAQIASFLALENTTPTFTYEKNLIGVSGILPSSLFFKKLKENFSFYVIDELMQNLIPQKNLLKVGVLSGQLSFDFLKQALENCDLLITGEVSLPLYNHALERNFPLIRLGHHYSEEFGIKSLNSFLKQNYPSLNIQFIDNYKPI